MNRRALETRHQLATENPQEPNYLSETAASHNNLGVVSQRLGEHEFAEQCYAEAIEIRRQLVDQFPAITLFQHHLAETHRVFGSLLTMQHRFDEAFEQLNQARQTYENLPEGTVGMAQSRWRLAETHQMIGDLHEDLERDAEATASYHKALELRTEILRDHSDRADYQIEMAVNRRVLGDHLRKTGDLDAAEEQLQMSARALAELAEKLGDSPRIDVERGSALRGAAAVALDRADLDTAADSIKQALAFAQTAVDAEPENAEYLRLRHAIRYWEARVLIRRGELAGAEQIAQDLASSESGDEDACFEAARIHAHCLRAIVEDKELTSSQSAELVAAHTARVQGLLEEASKRGLDLTKVDTDDFEPLRDQPEIARMLGFEPKCSR